MKTKKLFATGQSRYCQCCGAESTKLVAVIQKDHKTGQLQYCQACCNKNSGLPSIK